MSNFFKNMFGAGDDPQPPDPNQPRPLPPEAAQQLQMALEDLNAEDAATRARAALAVDNMAVHFARPDLRQRAIEPLLDALASADQETGLRALDALSREPLDIADDEVRARAVRYLSAVAEMDDEYVRGRAFGILAGIAVTDQQAAEIVMPMLIETLQQSPGQDLLAQKADAQAGGQTVGAQTLQSVADALRAESELRSKTARAIGQIGASFGEVARPAVPFLVEAAQQPEDYWLSAMATKALMEIDLPEVKAWIARFADDA